MKRLYGKNPDTRQRNLRFTNLTIAGFGRAKCQCAARTRLLGQLSQKRERYADPAPPQALYDCLPASNYIKRKSAKNPRNCVLPRLSRQSFSYVNLLLWNRFKNWTQYIKPARSTSAKTVKLRQQICHTSTFPLYLIYGKNQTNCRFIKHIKTKSQLNTPCTSLIYAHQSSVI